MNERICDFKIVAFFDGQKKIVDCDPKEGCLNDLVWSGIGVRNAAIKMLTKMDGTLEIKEIEAYVIGKCTPKED